VRALTLRAVGKTVGSASVDVLVMMSSVCREIPLGAGDSINSLMHVLKMKNYNITSNNNPEKSLRSFRREVFLEYGRCAESRTKR
jgi:hypothetical protein